ncbi:MAG: PQQ-binding-like beta-propeller repeat protein [Kiritimatiellaeota bacterium]|nr:PQQ-binding-like beta-propeller repeat protein [Kiritimatiellota bacterium]
MKKIAMMVLMLAAVTVRADWPEFRGPTADGQAGNPGLPLTWSETENVKWKTEIPFRGWATPVILGGQVWLANATLDGHDFYAMCLDEAPLGNAVNGYGSCSPAIEAGRVYMHFGSYGTACLDTKNFKTLWQRTDLPCRHYRGPSSSVVLFENLVILTLDGADQQYQIALDKQTGKTVWRTDRSVKFNDAEGFQKFAKDGDLRKAHSTPLIATIGGEPQMFIPGAKAAYAYDPRTGRELWQVQHKCWSAAPRPLFSHGLVLLITGSGKTEIWGVHPGGKGDVTDTHVAWKWEKSTARTASPVIVGDLLYMVNDDSTVTCLEVATGQLVWRERVGGNVAASPIVADGKIYLPNQQGKTFILNPGRTFAPIATNTLDIGCMASPAVDGKSLFLRTKTHLYRLEAAGK